jgi:hypothetical protein
VSQAYARHLGFEIRAPIMGEMSQHAASASSSDLTDVEIAYLECEREHWGPTGRKEQVVIERFGVSLPVFYQRLYRICESHTAWRYDPVLVRQIRDVADDVSSKRLRLGDSHG